MTLNQKIDALTAKYQALSDRLDAILPSSASPGAALRAIPSAIRSEVSRANGKKGGPPGRYYALHWRVGYGATRSSTGDDYVWVYGFDSKAERDEACENFIAPSHCPGARLEAVPCSDRNVRKALRGSDDVLAWAKW